MLTGIVAEAILSTEEKQLTACDTRRDGNVAVLGLSHDVIFLGYNVRTSILLIQLRVIEGTVVYQYGGFVEWHQKVRRQPKLEQIAIHFTMTITLGRVCWVAEIRALNKDIYRATCNHYRVRPFFRWYLAALGGTGDRRCCVDSLPAMAHSGSEPRLVFENNLCVSVPVALDSLECIIPARQDILGFLSDVQYTLRYSVFVSHGVN